MRWSQLGFGRTSSTSTTQATPRNLFGFKDGTRNIKAENADDMDRFVWVDDETDQPWMTDGRYLVTRRIRMLIESWDADFLADQETHLRTAQGHRRATDRPVRVRLSSTSRPKRRMGAW